MGPRILLYDIETAPNLAYVWGKWEQNVLDYVKEWSILSFSWKWLGDTEVHCETVQHQSEKQLLRKLWRFMDEADIVIAHNGNKFDNRKANARFVLNGMKPPSPYVSIDTRLVAKRYFAFDSNSLDDLAKALGLGTKLKHRLGFDLWKGVLADDPAMWKIMADYNKHDVVLLEGVYLVFRPWIGNHPNLCLIEGRPDGCPSCRSQKLKSCGIRRTKVNTYRRYRCLSCGAYSRSRNLDKNAVKPDIVGV
jgi:hypothetical protein